jgi:hypothetical protein
MNTFNKNSEKGQAIVLLVLSMIGLLAFTALAIDGGLVYSDRRIAQNAADAAAIAGAEKAGELLNGVLYKGWFCPENDAKDAAVANGLKNDFAITKVATYADLASVENGVATICNDAAHYIDVHVKLTNQTQTAFAHFVFSGVLKNTVEARARVYGQIPLGGGKAILAEDTECKKPVDGGIDFKGNKDVNVEGGGVHSNCDLTFSGSTGTVDVSGGGGITYNEDFGDLKGPPKPGEQNVTPPPEGNSEVIKVELDPPTCSGPNKGDVDGVVGGKTINPGTYKDLTVDASGEELTLTSGLYCIEGRFKVTGGLLTGNGVTLYFPDTAKAFNTDGNAVVKLSAPDPLPCEAPICPPAIGGVLIYYEPGGKPSSPEITLGGTSGSEYVGMIYAPNTVINVGGTSDMIGEETIEYGISIIGFRINVYGTTNIDITYDSDKMPQEDAWLRMER